MMFERIPLPREAQRVFERECERIAAQHDETIDFQPAYWVFTELYAHLEQPCRAANGFASAARNRLEDEFFSDQAGDPVVDPQFQLQIDQQVDLVVNALRHLPAR